MNFPHNFFISEDKDLLDVDFIHSFLANESYWARGISVETIKITITNSICFGVFTHEKNQVGYARVITDHATVAHIADVFIAKKYRGSGLSLLLMERILSHPIVKRMKKVYLFTHDAQELYRKFGFQNSLHPEYFMELKNLNQSVL